MGRGRWGEIGRGKREEIREGGRTGVRRCGEQEVRRSEERQEEKGGTDRGKLEKAKEVWMDEHSFCPLVSSM